MAVQKNILTKTPAYAGSAAIQPYSGEESTANLGGKVGTLAIGKVGTIVERAYGPVTRDAVITDTTLAFGAYKPGLGILVNPEDNAGVGTKFNNVTALVKGQVGTFLVSGATIVYGNQVQAIANAMKVQYLDSDWTSSKTSEVFVIEVNGFDNDVRSSSIN